MAATFEIDITRFNFFMLLAPEAVYEGAKRGIHDSMDIWKADSVNVAPLDKGTLRRSIDTKVKGSTIGTLVGEITGNAIERHGNGTFNYGYWLHEVSNGNLKTPGTIHKFLDDPGKQDESKFKAIIEREIRAELAARGLT